MKYIIRAAVFFMHYEILSYVLFIRNVSGHDYVEVISEWFFFDYQNLHNAIVYKMVWLINLTWYDMLMLQLKENLQICLNLLLCCYVLMSIFLILCVYTPIKIIICIHMSAQVWSNINFSPGKLCIYVIPYLILYPVKYSQKPIKKHSLKNYLSLLIELGIYIYIYI